MTVLKHVQDFPGFAKLFNNGTFNFKLYCSIAKLKHALNTLIIIYVWMQQMIPANFHDVTMIKFGEKSMTTLKTLFHVISAEKLVFKS